MKNRTWLSLLAIGIVSMFALSSCSTETTAPADDMAPLFMEVDATSSSELFVDPITITEGTLDQEPQLLEGDRPDKRRRGPDMRKHRGDDGMVHPFGRCLNQLDLTDDQVAQIRRALMAHHECVKGVWEGYREYMQNLLGRAREARKGIIEKVRNEEITREEAREALRAIHKRIKAQLESDGVRERMRNAIRSCDARFREHLATILTEEQLAQLRECMSVPTDKGPSGRDRDNDRAGDRDDDSDDDSNDDSDDDSDEDEDSDRGPRRRG